jgi:hypothetical protein
MPHGPTDKNRRRAGRPRAKHSSPDYSQITVYIRNDVRKAVKIRLFEEGQEMSSTVERLLLEWLATRPEDQGETRVDASRSPFPVWIGPRSSGSRQRFHVK